MRKNFAACAVLALLLAQLACNMIPPTPSGPAPLPPTATDMPQESVPTTALVEATVSPETIAVEALANFTYWIEDFNFPAALVDGQYSDGERTVMLVLPTASGDLNGDGVEDAAVVLAVDPSGSGTFYNLVALLSQNGMPVQAASDFIGDRQGIQNLTIVGGRVSLDYITQGPNDPLCCPSQHRLRSYILENGALHLASEQILDSPQAQAAPLPNAILIDQPVEMAPLTAPLWVSGRVSQMPPSGSLSYYVTSGTTLLASGEINVAGEPGGWGTFGFELNLTGLPMGLVQIEVVDAGQGMLLGRSVVVVLVQ